MNAGNARVSGRGLPYTAAHVSGAQPSSRRHQRPAPERPLAAARSRRGRRGRRGRRRGGHRPGGGQPGVRDGTAGGRRSGGTLRHRHPLRAAIRWRPNCSYPSPPADGLYGAKSPSEYDNFPPAAGTWRVHRTRRLSDASQVVDQCPDCATGHIDLSHGPRSRRKSRRCSAGLVNVHLRAPCQPGTARADRGCEVKEESIAVWLALLADQHREPAGLGGRCKARPAAGGTNLARASYNYWIAQSGAGDGPFTVRLTDTAGPPGHGGWHHPRVPGIAPGHRDLHVRGGQRARGHRPRQSRLRDANGHADRHAGPLRHPPPGPSSPIRIRPHLTGHGNPSQPVRDADAARGRLRNRPLLKPLGHE